MAATVQLNARMSPSLKAAGDEALALAGFSPTQAVRALWEKAALRGKDLEEVAELLSGDAAKSRSNVEGPDELASVWAYMDELHRSLGIPVASEPGAIDDRELLEEAMYERMEERGLA